MTTKQWWVGAALLVLAGLGWLYYDEPLQPQAQAWLDAVQARSQGGSVAYELLMGLDAPLAQDPRELGRRRLAEYAARPRMAMFAEVAAKPGPLLETPGFDVLCALGEAACFERFQADPGQAQRLLDEHGVLLQRYRAVLALTDFRTLLLPDLDEPFPVYGLMVKGNRLLGLQALLLAQAGDGRGARRLLEQDLKQLRNQLAESDQLVGKMVWVNLLAADLDLLARLRAHGWLDRLREQPALSMRERDMLPSLQREFAGSAWYFLRLADAPEAREEYSPGVLRTLYKPRQTVNLMFARERREAELAGLDAVAFAAQARQVPPPLRPWQRPNNPVGVILANIAAPRHGYVARLHDLDARLRLFNLLARLPVGEAPSADWLAAQPDAGNPYEPGSPPSLAEQGTELCYSGPPEDSRELRCLTLREQRPSEPAFAP